MAVSNIFSDTPEKFLQSLPDHTQLPDSDGTFVKNFQEHPQSILLTEAIIPFLEKKHPDHQYCIGQDCGIYWQVTEPPEKGAIAPDWFYVPHVPPDLNGQMRRSYVLWKEMIAPLIVIELVSGNGSQEKDRTPWKGKFWIYETVIRPAYYVIYQVQLGQMEVYQFVVTQYQPIEANIRGHYPIEALNVELGIWENSYQNVTLPWLRWWDNQGNLLLTGAERAQQEHQRAERLAQKLRELGVNPDDI